MNDLETIRQRLNENLRQVRGDEYHKRSILLGLAVELEAMMDLNISIPKIVVVLEKSGLKVSAHSLRSFFESRFREEYREYLYRNGWHRPKDKESAEPLKQPIERRKEVGSSTVKKAIPGENPLRVLSGKPKEGEFHPIPTAKFEVDNS